MNCTICKGGWCDVGEDACFECCLLADFNNGEAIDDPEEFFDLIPGWLKELTELRARIAGLEK